MARILILLFICCGQVLYCQTDGLLFEGANRTSLTWLSSLAGIGDSTAIMTRLQNTGLFQEVDCRTENDTLVFSLVEKNYFVPLLGFNLAKDHQNYYFLGASDFNLFGRGMNLYASTEWFGRLSGELFLDATRWIRFRHGPIANVKVVNTIEPIYFDSIGYDYNYSNRLGKLGYGVWLSPTWQAGFTTSYFQEMYQYAGLEEIGLPEIDAIKKGSIELFTNWQDLRYHYHNIEGFRIYGSYEYTQDFSEHFDFQKFYLNGVRYWMPNEKSMLAGQVRLGYSNFNDSPFPAFFVDDFKNVRGVGDRVARGSSETTLNLEWRQTLWKSSLFYFQVVPFADYTCVLPSDYKSNPDPIWNHDYFRLGGGVRLGTYKFYNSCLRLDATLDPSAKKFTGWVIGVGQYF